MPRGYAFVYFSKVEDAIRVRAKLTTTTTTKYESIKRSMLYCATHTHTHDTR